METKFIISDFFSFFFPFYFYFFFFFKKENHLSFDMFKNS